MAWTSIVECADGTFYVGSTTDLGRRFAQHQNGDGAAYTRHRRPVRLVWAAEFARVDDAFAYEKRIQGWGRAKRIALIEGRVGDLPALASRAWRHRGGDGGGGFETVAAQPPQPPGDGGGFETVAAQPPQPPGPPDAVGE